MNQAHDPYAPLRHRDYRQFLIGNMLATVGSQMQSVAVGWELYDRTGRSDALGYVGLVQFLPVLLLSLPAGHAADRYNRKMLLLGAVAMTALASLGLAALSFFQGPVPLVYLCLLLGGIGQAINFPARWALWPQLIPEEFIGAAITWNSSGWQVAAVAGPALGGFLIALSGGAVAVYLAAVACALAFFGLLASTRPRPAARPAETFSPGTLLAGLRFVTHSRLILATITLDLFAVLLGGATALLPVFAEDILKIGPIGLGWLRAAPSIGAFGMAFTLAHRPPFRRAGRALLWAVAGFGVATIVFGLSTNAILSFVMLALTGALDNISVVVRATLVQVLTPDALRGRVTAVNAVFISSSNELGAFESGITAQLFGPVLSVVSGGVGTLLVVGAAMAIWPEILRLGPLQRPVEESPGPESKPVESPTV
jgi:MFS family permease